VARGDVGDPDSADLRPVIVPEPDDLRISITSIVHWADSTPLRREVMAAVDFPYDDLGMFLVVNQLTYNGAMRPSTLVQVLGATATNMSKIIGRLVDADLAVRVAAPDDDRGVLVALTGRGREIGERIVARATQSMADALADWPAEDVATLTRLLARFATGATDPRPAR
jgi:DNA-binding MarR family transcriptional regulator